jgi:hypothetical protein
MNTEAICLCAAGSLCVQLLTLIDIVELRTDQRPDFKNFAFYLSFVVFPLISGITGYAYSEDTVHINKMLALQLGASSPLLFKNLTDSIPPGIVSR